jgi:hypothetical protein
MENIIFNPINTNVMAVYKLNALQKIKDGTYM